MINIRPAGVLLRAGRVLTMNYHYPGGVRLNLPGGNQEPDESAAATVAREWREELGMSVAVGRLLLVAETLVAERAVLHLLFAVEGEGEPCLEPGHTRAVGCGWLTLAELESAPLYPALGAELARRLRQGVGPECGYLGRIAQPWL